MRPRLLIAAALLAGGACAGAPDGTARIELDLPEQGARLADRAKDAVDLHGDEALTIRLLRVTAPIALHRHRESEETLYLIAGEGLLHLASGDRALRAGDLVVLPRATPHGFTPTGPEPAVILQVFTPRLRDGDSIPDGGAR